MFSFSNYIRIFLTVNYIYQAPSKLDTVHQWNMNIILQVNTDDKCLVSWNNFILEILSTKAQVS